MAIITFPNSPTNGQEFTDPNGTDWKYIVNRWEQLYQTFTASDIALVDLVGLYTATDVEGALAEVHQDKAPLASPTFTGVTTVADLTATEPITVARTTPKIFLQDTNQPADAQLWRFQGNNDLFALAAVADDETTVQLQVFTADRTTGVVSFDQGSITAFKVPAPTAADQALRWGSNAEVSTLTATGNLYVTKSNPQCFFYDSAGTIDQRRLQIIGTTGYTYIRPINDAGTETPVGSPIIISHINGDVLLDQGGVVKVPVPTETGHALRWDSDATIAELTTTNNIMVESGSPAITLYETDGSVDARQFKMVRAGFDTLFRTVEDDNQTLVREWVVFDEGSGTLNMTGSASVEVPTPTADTHATTKAYVDSLTAERPMAGALPPVSPTPGTIWVMPPVDHVAVYTASGWKPVWPQTDNQAVTTGDTFNGINGLWAASEGD